MKKILLFLILIAYTASAQETYIVVYKGKVLLKGKCIECFNRYSIEEKDTVITASGKIDAIIYNKLCFIEQLKGNTRYTMPILKSLLKKQIPTSLKKHLLNTHKLMSVEKFSEGETNAGVRALSKKRLNDMAYEASEFVYPSDSTRVVADSLQFFWKLKDEVYSARLKIVNTTTNEIVYDQVATNKGDLTIPLTKEGNYTWTLYSGLEDKTYIDQSFVKLSPSETQLLVKEYNDFKAEIEAFELELKVSLQDDYLYENKIVID